MPKEKHSLSSYHLQQGSSGNTKIAAIANKIWCKTLARSSPAALVLACKSRKLTFPKFTKRLKKLTRLSILLFFKFLKFTKSCSPGSRSPQTFKSSLRSQSTNVEKFPRFSMRSSKRSLSSQSGSPKVPSALNPALQVP
jgi:hypothetical protein